MEAVDDLVTGLSRIDVSETSQLFGEAAMFTLETAVDGSDWVDVTKQLLILTRVPFRKKF
jgi:hypothetical protein